MSRPLGAGIARSLAWGAGAAAIATVVLGAVRDDYSASSLGRGFLIGLGFATSIGLPATVVFTLLRPRLEQRPPLSQALSAMGLLLAITSLGGMAVSLMCVRLGIFEARGFWAAFRTSVAIAVAFTAASGAGAIVYEGLRRRHDKLRLTLETTELERRRAEVLAAQAQLSSLEQRVHPHFLFNALNAVLALIPDHPERAERVLERLAALLRFSLDTGARGLHPLSKEMAVVADYFEIEQVRFEERLRFRIEVPPELGPIEVPPFAVQTLVENAVKHVVARRREGAELTVSARREDGHLVVLAVDDGPGFGEDALRAGHGLENLRARLRALYGQAASLAILPSAAGARVELRVPLRGETGS